MRRCSIRPISVTVIEPAASVVQYSYNTNLTTVTTGPWTQVIRVHRHSIAFHVADSLDGGLGLLRHGLSSLVVSFIR